MNSLQSVDYLILGAGLSGLSMAVRMHQAGLLLNKKLVILDQRQTFSQDKSWCAWQSNERHPFAHCVSKSWSNWSVHYQQQTVSQHSQTFQYQYIAAKDFYDFCLAYIQQTTEIELRLNTHVTQVVGQQVSTEQASWHGNTVIDARAPTKNFEPVGHYLLQCFYGWRIKVAKPIFNPQHVTLMDFAADQSLGINFMYVLPFSSTEAILEPTYFLHHQRIPDENHFLQLLKSYFAHHYPSVDFAREVEILQKEQGILPMMHMPASNTNPQVISIGTAHGLLRPSTGYAYFGIQRYIEHVINALQHHQPVPQQAYSAASGWMDNVFLKVCRRHPARAAGIFFQMFSGANSDIIVRFLQDEGSWRDYLRVIRSVPALPFLREVVYG